MAMPTKPYHHGDLKAQLVAVTREVVDAEGPEAVTIARVARACNVSVAAPYRHFPDKHALLGAVADGAFAELEEVLVATAHGHADGQTRLIEVGAAYVEFAESHPHVFRLMFDAALRHRSEEAGPRAQATLRRLIDASDVRVPADVAVRATWGLAHGLAMLRLGRMLTFIADDGPQRLREELGTLLHGILESD